MAEITLAITYRNYSSWSLRAWLALKLTRLPFEVVRLPLGTPEFEKGLAAYGPARRVPALRADSLLVWDSLAICETAAELCPDAPLWPETTEARAYARALAAEMHSSFESLRAHMPMNIRAHRPGKGDGPGVRADVERVADLWEDARERYRDQGPFLCGGFGLADAMYAPVAFRFRTYQVALPARAADYAREVLSHPLVREWEDAARAETETLAQYEL